MRTHISGVVAVALLASSGCGLNMEKHYKKIRDQMVAGQYDSVDKYLDSAKEDFYKKDNRLLYYMDKGMVLHLGKRYEESNKFLEQAKSTAEELWTESISANIEAFLTTDNSIPYQGEDFEKVLIHFVAALNNIGLKDYEAARIEARQVTNKLQLYAQKYDEMQKDEAEKTVSAYRDDAFARWLSGKLAETEGEHASLNDAWIDYKKAIAVYERDYGRYQTPMPHGLYEDAMRCLEGLGADFADERADLARKYGSSSYRKLADTKGLGEIVFVHLSGEAPYKKDEFWTATAGSDIVRIAFPQFVPRDYLIRGARLQAGEVTAQTELAEDISAIAVQNLDDHMGRIKVKTIARAIAKYIASKGAQAGGEQIGGTAGGLMQIAGAAFMYGSAIAEEADKRSWITLPASVHVGHMYVPAGDTTLNVEFLGPNGNIVETAQLTATVEAGKSTFVSYRTYR